jgi:hypothetical protein
MWCVNVYFYIQWSFFKFISQFSCDPCFGIISHQWFIYIQAALYNARATHILHGLPEILNGPPGILNGLPDISRGFPSLLSYSWCTTSDDNVEVGANEQSNKASPSM